MPKRELSTCTVCFICLCNELCQTTASVHSERVHRHGTNCAIFIFDFLYIIGRASTSYRGLPTYKVEIFNFQSAAGPEIIR